MNPTETIATVSEQTTHPRLLAPYLLALRNRFVLGGLLVVANTAVGVGVPFLLRYAIDDLTAGTMTSKALFAYSGGYLLAAVTSSFFSWSMRRVMLALGFEVESRIRTDLFNHLTRMDAAFYRRERTGDIMTKMSADLQSVREYVSQGFLQGTRTVVGLGFAFAIMFMVNTYMATVMLFLLPTISITFFVLMRMIRRRYDAVQEHYSTVSNFVQECFAGIRVVKGFGLESRMRKRFQNLNEENIRRNLDLSKVERPIWPMMGLFFAFGVVLLILVGGRQVLSGRMSLGEFVQFNLYLFYVQWPMLALGWTANLLQRGRASWRRICTLFDAVPAISDGDWTDHSLRTVDGPITFHHVSLHLEGRAVLEDLNLTIPTGATVGITGPTGSGKTQLVSLVARLAEPTLGEVRLGNRDVRAYPLDVLRANVGFAPQEPFLFSDTLANNIAFGLSDTFEEKVLWAAEVAQLRSEAEQFPDGFQTLLGERGVTLSGGQRQRTAISRAVARNPNILVLDDVFSAIDTQTEAQIFSQLLAVARERTTLLISHRVSTLRAADFIVVIEGGRLTQQGPHATLVQQPGYYRDLDEIQRLATRLEEVSDGR